MGLHLETSTWLSSPVFMEKPGGGAASLKVEARGWSLQPSPGKHENSSHWTGKTHIDVAGKSGELIVKGPAGLVESRVSLPAPAATVERLQVRRRLLLYFFLFGH